MVTPAPTALQNEVSTYQKIYYNKEALVMVIQSVNKFYSRSPFKIDALTQDIVLPLDIAINVFNSSSPDKRDFLI